MTTKPKRDECTHVYLAPDVMSEIRSLAAHMGIARLSQMVRVLVIEALNARKTKDLR